MVFHHFAGGTATRLSKAEQDLQRWGPSLGPGSWAASPVGSPRPPSELQQPSAPSPASSNPGAHAAVLTSQALQAGAHSRSRPEQLTGDAGHVTMGQSRHSNGAAEAVNQTTLSAGQRQSSVLACLLGHKLEIQVGCRCGHGSAGRPICLITTAQSVGMWPICAPLQGCLSRMQPGHSADQVQLFLHTQWCAHLLSLCYRMVALAVPK